MLVRPRVEYAASIWDPHTKDQINSIEKIQRRAARVVTNDHRKTSSVTKMLKVLNWPTLEDRRKAARLTHSTKSEKKMLKSAQINSFLPHQDPEEGTTNNTPDSSVRRMCDCTPSSPAPSRTGTV